MYKHNWKSRAVALALVGAIALPGLAQPGTRRREGRQERREEPRGRRQNRRGADSSRNSYTGTVVSRRSSTNFDLRVGGQTYNVYATNRLPRGLDRDDRVRVTGQRVGSNDIRNATATVIRNR